MNKIIDWEAHRQFIIDNYDNMTREELSEVVGCNVNTFGIRMRKWNMPKKNSVRHKRYNDADNSNAGANSLYNSNLGDYAKSVAREKQILNKLHIGSNLKFKGDKAGTVENIVGKIIIVSFNNYNESFTVFQFRKMITSKEVRIET